MIDDVRQEPGKRKALVLTVLMHVLLVAVLFFGVQWKRSQPDVVEVELWSNRPVAASLPPPPPDKRPEPKPEPKPNPDVTPSSKPDIAVKEEKKPKPEPKKPEPPKPDPKPEPKIDPFREAMEREQREQKQRTLVATAAREQQMRADAEAEQRAAAGRRGLADYAAKIRGKIRGNIVLPPAIQGNPEAVFDVTQLPSGEVLAVKLRKSSGNGGLDAAIERAILKSSPLPKPDDPALFRRELDIKYKPFEE